MSPSQRLEKTVLRSLVFNVFSTKSDSQFASIPGEVAMLAVNNGYLTPKHPGSYDENVLNHADKQVILEIVWELLTQGLLMPGSTNGGAEFPFFHLTEYGHECITHQEILPHDYEGYIKNINTIFIEPDAVFMTYLIESIQAFLKNLYISTVVNLGVATERLVELLIISFRDNRVEKSELSKFDEAINKARFPAAQFEVVYRRLELEKASMSDDLKNSLSMLKFIQEIIRTERNDAGHPTGRKFTREESFSYLLTFPSYVKIYSQVQNWINS